MTRLETPSQLQELFSLSFQEFFLPESSATFQLFDRFFERIRREERIHTNKHFGGRRIVCLQVSPLAFVGNLDCFDDVFVGRHSEVVPWNGVWTQHLGHICKLFVHWERVCEAGSDKVDRKFHVGLRIYWQIVGFVVEEHGNWCAMNIFRTPSKGHIRLQRVLFLGGCQSHWWRHIFEGLHFKNLFSFGKFGCRFSIWELLKRWSVFFLEKIWPILFTILGRNYKTVWLVLLVVDHTTTILVGNGHVRVSFKLFWMVKIDWCQSLSLHISLLLLFYIFVGVVWEKDYKANINILAPKYSKKLKMGGKLTFMIFLRKEGTGWILATFFFLRCHIS